MATFNPLAWLDAELTQLDELGLRRRLTTRTTSQGPIIEVAGKQLVNFGSNDYLGLANDERIVAAVRESLEKSGWGAGASPLITGRSEVHAQLEHELAKFEATEAALVFPTGFAANAGTIAALVDSHDAVYSDQKNHASLIDGCRLSGAKVHIFRHTDPDHLETLLAAGHHFRRRLIVTDSLFSMDGDVAPLREFAELAEKFQAMLLVDEAHATGVSGEHGRGVVESLGLEDRVAVRVGTLSKALGGHGGFVAGSKSLIDWLTNRARPYFFSTAAPAAVAAVAMSALKIAEHEPWRRTELLSNAASLRSALREQGWNVGNSTSQIVPVYVGTPVRAMDISATLRDQGLFVPGIRPPSVPEGESLLRISLCYGHSAEMRERLLTTLKVTGL